MLHSRSDPFWRHSSTARRRIRDRRSPPAPRTRAGALIAPQVSHLDTGASGSANPQQPARGLARTDMGNRTTATILFILALTMFALGVAMRGLPPVVTAIGFVVIGLHILRKAP